MAARMRKTHQDDVRAKIKTSQLINRLEDHALGHLDLTTTQIKAIEVLIRKTLPDLSSVELGGDPANPIETNLKVEGLTDEQLRALASIPVQSD
jgi:hypothetical protein